MNTGIEIGAIRTRNSTKSQPTVSPIRRFCGSPTRVASPPSAVPTIACISRLRRKARNCSRSPRIGSSTRSSSRWSWSSSRRSARGEAVVDHVEAGRHRDHDGRDRERVQERGEHGRGTGERQREQQLRAHVDEQLREHEQQDVAHEVDARDHEHQQQDDGEVRLRLLVDRVRAGHPEDRRPRWRAVRRAAAGSTAAPSRGRR